MSMEEDYSSEDLTSDEELQEEFARGNLHSGLIQRALPPKTFTNNVAGLRAGLDVLREKECDWLEQMDVVATALPTSIEEKDVVDPEDDFKREMHFYQQALSSVEVGLKKLEEFGVPTKRPDDYFAEMLKTDDHMRKVRQNLLTRQKILEKKDKLRKLREQKKFGKKVQHEVLQKRREEKKASLDSIKRYKKGKGEKPSFLANKDDEDDFPVAAHRENRGDRKSGDWEKSKKRQMRDKTYGFGGKKRRLKSNTADSSADMSTFSAGRHSRTGRGIKGGVTGGPRGRAGAAAAPGKNGKKGRLGKSRRQKMKLKR